jgi:Ca-activated chloride channel family protein
MKLQQPRRSRLLLHASGLLLLNCAALLAQSVSAPSQNPASNTPPQPAVQQAAPPAVQPTTQPVRLNVSVTDASNSLVADLRQEDFRVEEDGVPQTITYFAREELPVSYALVVDNSGSTRNVLDYLLRASGVLVSANKPDDETLIVRFVGSEQINVMQDFTGNQTALMRALEEMFVEGGQTAVIDAVYTTAERVGERRRDESGRRRALVLLSDGEDRASYYKLSELQKLLRQNDVQIFVVGLVSILPKGQGIIRKSAHDQALAMLNMIAQETGGHAFYPKNVKDLQDAVAAITRELRTQYVIGYQSSNPARDGKFRKVQVKLNEAAREGGAAKRTVRVRSGYFAAGAKGAEKPESKDKRPRLKSW